MNVDTNYDVKAFHGTDFLDQLVSTASEKGTRYRSGGLLGRVRLFRLDVLLELLILIYLGPLLSNLNTVQNQ
jgi:hypothetical protein